MIRRLVVLFAVLAVTIAPALAHGKAAHGGQLVETNEYQFEFVVEKGPHIDMYVIDPKDKAVTNAKITLRVTTPDAKKLMVPLKFEDSHYTAPLGIATKGNYDVVVLSTVGTQKMNARFSFKI